MDDQALHASSAETARNDYYPMLEFIADRTSKPSLLPDAWALLRKLSAVADAGRFALEPEDEVDGGTASDVLSAASGRPVDMIVTASLGDAHDHGLVEHGGYRAMFDGNLPVPPGHAQREESLMLWGILDGRLQTGLDAAIEATLKDTRWESLAPLVSDEIRDALYLYFFHVIAGNDDDAARLLSYLDLCTRALPVGEFAASPGAWLVVKA